MLPSTLTLLLDCGGGSEKNTVDKPTTIEIQNISLDIDNHSSLLKHNPSPKGASVKFLDNFLLEIVMTDINMQGDFRFLKIMDKAKSSLFLGQANRSNNIKVPHNIFIQSFVLTVDFFSELNKDKTISYEVNYD